MLDFARPSNGNFHKLYKLLETHMTYQLLDVRELSNPLENLRGKRKSDNNQFVDAVFVFFIHFGGFTFFFWESPQLR